MKMFLLKVLAQVIGMLLGAALFWGLFYLYLTGYANASCLHSHNDIEVTCIERSKI